VYAPGKVTCGKCGYCRSGYGNLCANKETIGMKRPGALAEYLSVTAEPLRRLPDGVSAAEGAAMQPFASALVCTIDAGIDPGDVVAVVGAGVMGASCAQYARHLGAREVFAVDVDPRKLDLAAENGLVPVDVGERSLEDAVAEVTDGIGADVVFAAVGGDQSHGTRGNDPLAVAGRTVRSAGTLVQVGLLIGEIIIEPRVFRSKSVRWVNPRLGVASAGPNTDTGDLAPRLVADGRIDVGAFVTHELGGLDSFEEAVAITPRGPRTSPRACERVRRSGPPPRTSRTPRVWSSPRPGCRRRASTAVSPCSP
jgi:threonine dehydrogenase-like Zn-dependent dehydrogenase